ncbi:hypothetical protein GCM10010121_096170 [Streptomyces brasiliensis]|uniref:FAD/NAD(P)-binding domain-containing protein n=1 Tax=Streptomyces brasiliensis TaxID=1954 RepID=A0A917PBV7_9ACTN|nr:hypothetical protein GCM10010121_096170 [Streptomyces brasiliensis]
MVVGGNAVGLEQAQLFARLGTRVSVIEALNRLAPFEEPEVSAAIEEVFTGEGIAVYTGTALTAVRRDGHGYTLTAGRGSAPTELRAEQLLVATGRRPVTAGLNLDRVGVKTGERGEVVDHRPRHRERVLQEQVDVPHRAHLEREAKLVVLRPPQGDQVPVDVVQEEEPLQLGPRRLLGERPWACSSLRNSTGTSRTVITPEQARRRFSEPRRRSGTVC